MRRQTARARPANDDGTGAAGLAGIPTSAQRPLRRDLPVPGAFALAAVVTGLSCPYALALRPRMPESSTRLDRTHSGAMGYSDLTTAKRIVGVGDD